MTTTAPANTCQRAPESRSQPHKACLPQGTRLTLSLLLADADSLPSPSHGNTAPSHGNTANFCIAGSACAVLAPSPFRRVWRGSADHANRPLTREQVGGQPCHASRRRALMRHRNTRLPPPCQPFAPRFAPERRPAAPATAPPTGCAQAVEHHKPRRQRPETHRALRLFEGRPRRESPHFSIESSPTARGRGECGGGRGTGIIRNARLKTAGPSWGVTASSEAA